MFENKCKYLFYKLLLTNLKPKKNSLTKFTFNLTHAKFNSL